MVVKYVCLKKESLIYRPKSIDSCTWIDIDRYSSYTQVCCKGVYRPRSWRGLLKLVAQYPRQMQQQLFKANDTNSCQGQRAVSIASGAVPYRHQWCSTFPSPMTQLLKDNNAVPSQSQWHNPPKPIKQSTRLGRNSQSQWRSTQDQWRSSFPRPKTRCFLIRSMTQ